MLGRRSLILISLIVVFGGAGLVKAAEELKARYNPEAYHINHDENGVDCEKCHLQAYKSNTWVKVKKPSIVGPTIGRYTMPQNLTREVDKTQCLECHRWGADNERRFYGGPSAEAGELYK